MVRTYTTVSGDTWDYIAYKTLGDERLASQFIEANIEHVETVIFPAGVQLKIPEIEEPISTNLPPWKRGNE